MRHDFSENQKTNLGALCLDLYEDIESHYPKGTISVQGKPRGNSFEKDIQITDAMYCALYVFYQLGLLHTAARGGSRCADIWRGL